MKKLLLHLAVILVSISSYSQIGESLGARASALGNATISSVSFWSITNNVSSLAFIDKTAIGLDVQNNFMLEELTTGTLVFLLPVNKYGTFSFALSHFGYSAFNQSKIAISYSKKVAEYTALGLQISNTFQKINSEELTSLENLLAINISFFTHLNEKLHLGSSFIYKKNIEADNDFKKLIVGLSWFPISDLNILAQIEKSSINDVNLSSGIEYKIYEKIFARIGYSSNPISVSCGIGIHFKTIDIDISATHHQYLGMTSGISSNYIFNNNTQ